MQHCIRKSEHFCECNFSFCLFCSFFGARWLSEHFSVQFHCWTYPPSPMPRSFFQMKQSQYRGAAWHDATLLERARTHTRFTDTKKNYSTGKIKIYAIVNYYGLKMKLTANRCGRGFWPIRPNHKPIHTCHVVHEYANAAHVQSQHCASAKSREKDMKPSMTMAATAKKKTRGKPHSATTASVFNLKREIMHFASHSPV